MFNKVVIAGNVTRDIEVKYTQSGQAVTTLGVALNESWTDKNTGQKQERTTFVDVAVFGKQAENCGQYLSKGSKVLVEGKLNTETWTDQQSGQNRSKLAVKAQNVQFLDSKPQGQQQAPQQGYQQPQQQQAPQQGYQQPQQQQAPQGTFEQPARSGGIAEDDIPF